MIQLNANSLDLTGRTLIEASAGTGKTYTIASLYLRYIVEQPFDKPLTTDKILVVTFTRAATAELRDRIRQRLHEAVACFRGKKAQNDDVIEHLLSTYRDQKEEVLKRLYAAEKTMDDAAIFTIHGFCHRALTRNAFSTASGAVNELLEDEDSLISQAAEDFWRQLLYPLTGDAYLEVVAALKKPMKNGAQAPSPANLMRQIKGLLSLKSLTSNPAPSNLSVGELADSLRQQRLEQWLGYAKKWALLIDTCNQELKSIPRARSSSIDGHIQSLSDWLRGPTPVSPPKASINYIKKQVVEKADVAKLGLSTVERLLQSWDEFEAQHGFRPALLSQALKTISEQVMAEKQKLQMLAPDDLMRVLHEALHLDGQGQELGKALLQQYPVAMIDEFQDTDPLQFGIFEHIYKVAEPDSYSWLMIGDPKQSIYSFRGGDIHTYGMAKTGTSSDRHLSLDTNYRSTECMVASINHLFGQCLADEFVDTHIQYEPVQSKDKGQKGNLIVDHQSQAGLNFWTFEPELMVGNSAADMCAEQVALLLNGGNQGRALMGNKPVTPGDIAILVRDRFEAEAVAQQLRARQVRSVFLSRDSVFSTGIATELLRVLEAFHEPRNERLLMAALANSIACLTASELSHIRNNEALWQFHQSQFSTFHTIWHKQGVLAAIHRWMDDYQIASHLMADTLNGERQLADLMHASELLQAQSLKLEGTQSLLRYFRRTVQEPDNNNRSQQRRLESDSDLVQIVTIHASKGLEYPVVMIPFGLARRDTREAIYPDQGKTMVDFSNPEAGLQRADKERLAEEIRLFYVAVTRAVYSCYIGLAQQRSSHSASALGYLLNSPDAEPEQIARSIQQLCQTSNGAIASMPYTACSTSLEKGTQPIEQTFSAKRFTGQLEQQWRLTSYSALASHKHSSVDIVPGMNDEFETPITPDSTSQDQHDGRADRFTFVKGAQAGNALHNMLEYQQFSDCTSQELYDIVGAELHASGIDEAQFWQPIVTDWLADVLATPMLDGGKSMRDLHPAQALPEMEFHMSVVHQVDAHRFNGLLARYPVLGCPVKPLSFDAFHGLMKGFIDLTYEWQGKFYVCDYKSNHLGYQLECYSQENMSRAMAEHRYDAQLVFYTLALHRLLKQRMGDNYRYQDHIGGGVYLFLRGMSETNGGETGVIKLRPHQALIEQLDELLGTRSTNSETQL
ncbi:exodeoxyribonuclease V subunit beta [Echinimonas agarilytica]|uniref:RecBCD enzyme subunit RecB n=1 Tax=Echinimonas agarilytica TaxID=1215918 RepID=A0AA41WBC0_9GAMM|nr:exodeoxyribonuclease V subunit beta [Echinimonas agarilytica]MCM2681231.1 exodeoxyribonuclease V subunit beta [Echinimonas agarilytica]